MKPNCFNCAYYIAFTKSEATAITTYFHKIGRNISIWGGCSFKRPGQNYLLRWYLPKPLHSCPDWEEGPFAEDLGKICPLCKRVPLVIRRPRKDNYNFIVINCINYPTCKFTSRYLPLNYLCKNCGTAVVLHVGDRIKCICPTCKINLELLISPAIWPVLTFGQRTYCPHGFQKHEHCILCKRHLDVHKNLLNLEIYEVATSFLQNDVLNRCEDQSTSLPIEIINRNASDLIENPYTIWEVEDDNRYESDYHDPIWVDEDDQEYDELYQESRDIYHDSVVEYSVGAARSHNEGWFYSDDDGDGYYS